MILNKRVISAFLILGFLSAIASCSGQASKQNTEQPFRFELALGDTVTELSDSLWYIYQDTRQNYWFGSNGQGVFYYDGKTILNFRIKHGLSNDSIRQIQEDKKGNMYFSTLGGINKFDGKTIIALQPIKSKDWKSEPDDMWFSMLGKKGEHGPYRYDGVHLYNLEFPKHYLHETFYESGINSFFSPYEIYCIYKDRQGNMWFGTSVFGACRFDGKSIKWMYEEDLTIVPNGGSFGIRSIFEDREGKFWICNTRHRYLFDWTKTAKTDRLVYQKTNGVGNAQVFEGDDYIYYSHIIEDEKGDIWLTTWSSGVYKFDGKNISHYPVTDGGESVNLVSMYKDRKGDLWLGTPDRGVFKWKGKSFEKFSP